MASLPEHLVEIELKFLVPSSARAALVAEMVRGASTVARTSLTAMYLDTPDRRLASAGLAWRLRREGHRWIQALKAGGTNALERFEHEVMRPDATPDISLHAGTPAGDRLIALLDQARADGEALEVRFRTEIRRTTRRVRTRGAVVEVAFDEGRIVAADKVQRIREIEFELVAGSCAAMLAMAERWRKRFGLIYDPRSKAEQGDRLAAGDRFPDPRCAARLVYPADADPVTALCSVLDECLAQITRNAIGLIDGDPALRVEHVHQLRVGIRRLRSALRSFRDWAPAVPAGLEAGLRILFSTLGESRGTDVMSTGVVAQLSQAGAPPIAFSRSDKALDPSDACRTDGAQQTFLAWIAWRAALTQMDPSPALARQPQRLSVGTASQPLPAPDGGPADGELAATAVSADVSELTPRFADLACRRIARWHKQIVAHRKRVHTLDEAALHDLRKHIKRQRYAVEFFAPVLRRRQVRRYLKALNGIQERMGELNDLFVARARYQSALATDPAAWFALGWLAARIAAVRSLAAPALGTLWRVDPPRAAGGFGPRRPGRPTGQP